MRGLVVGRFQPLHLGHVRLIRRAIEDCVNVAVAIGSTDHRQGPRDPFTFDERRAMVQAALGGAVEVYAVPDIHDPANYARHVLAITGPVDKVYGNDDRTLDLFDFAGIPAVRPGLVERDRLEASTVRMQMAEDDPAWRKAVPKEVAAYLDGIDAPRRIRLLEAKA